jgi:nucleoside-diphosphate-sugar epimerase
MARHARDAGLAVTVVRPYSGYGEDQSEDFPFGAFIGRARRREDPFEVWNGAAVRDWIHIDDVVAGALAVVESGTEEPVSLCTGVGTSMLELAGMVCDRAGYSPKVVERADMPSGVNHRVGDPTVMNRYYRASVSLSEGVERALR